MNAAEILKEHRQRLVNIIRRWCRNNLDFEDILQNIMLKVHSSGAQFEGRAALSTWLYRVAVNESIDYYRKNRRFSEGRVDIDGIFLADDRGGPEKDAEIREKKLVMEEIIGGLEDERRAVFTLYFINGMTIDEMAGIFQISKNAIRCRIHKAKQQVMREAETRGLK